MSTSDLSQKRKRWSVALTHSEVTQAVSMYKFCSLTDVCECVCISVFIPSLNSVTQRTYFPPPPHLFLSDNVTIWTRTDLSRGAESWMFSELSIWSPHNSFNSLPFARWECSSHHSLLFLFSFSPFSERVHSADRLSLIWRLLGSSRGVGGADGNRWWFILEACWDTSTPHIPFCLLIAAKAGVARPSFGGGQMVPFGEGPQHSALCSWGSTGAAKNKHGLLLFGTCRSFILQDLNRLGEWDLKLCMCILGVTLMLVVTQW